MTSSQNGDHFHSDFGGAEAPHHIPSDSYDAVDNKFGDPEIPPRIGDEYQVDIPPLFPEANYASNTRKCIVAETARNPFQNFLIGLPIPLTWISSQKQDSKNALNVGEYNGPGYYLVPGLFEESWSAAEKDSFLLGLYIFEKNFVEVRRFVGTKEMGALLSFYYGKFYGSQEYHRWSECRKMKSKKGVYGRRLFLGLRQQELMSRILPRVSEECRNTLSEVSKTFNDEKMSLAEYVSSLKSMVGMSILVEAVGIGTGKQDLTTMALEPSKSNQAVPTRPEIPTGKACSSLTTSEIIKFLSGDYRLSKARSNDLFWEAVWPRLLARGWHSEQPKNQGYVKNCLVFLIPGIKKFSRRKLVKEVHYFDSVTDVLSKVAKEPGLIELDNEDDDDVSKNEEKKSGVYGNDSPMRQRHYYLQPRRTPKRNTVVMKFTVVDTSLSGGKIRELRSLPSEIPNVVNVQDCNEDSSSDEDSLEETTDESETIDTAKSDEDMSRVCPDISGVLVRDPKNEEGFQEKYRSRKNNAEFRRKDRSRKNKDESVQEKDRSKNEGLQENDHSRKNSDDLQEKDRSCKNKDEGLQENDRSRSRKNKDEGLQEKVHSRKNKDDLQENNRPRKNKDEVLQEKDYSRKNKDNLQENDQSRKNKDEGLLEKVHSRKNKDDGLHEKVHSRKNKDDGLHEKVHSRKNEDESSHENDQARKNKDEGSQERIHSRKIKEEFQEKNQESRKPSKSPVIQKLKQGNEDHMGLTTKRCKTLNSRSQDETNTGFPSLWAPPILENGLSTCSSGTHETIVNSSSQVGSTCCSSSVENSQTRTLFDLNLPQIPPETEDGIFLTAAESSKEHDSHLIKNKSLPKISAVEADLNPRRHSTRNRPPTTRALEALANGYLTVNRRRKIKDNNTPDDMASSRPSQRARIVVEPNESTNSSVASHVDQEGENGVSDDGNLTLFVNSEGPQQGNEESVSGQ